MNYFCYFSTNIFEDVLYCLSLLSHPCGLLHETLDNPFFLLVITIVTFVGLLDSMLDTSLLVHLCLSQGGTITSYLRAQITLSLYSKRTSTQVTLRTHQAYSTHFWTCKHNTLMCLTTRAKENIWGNGNWAIVLDGTPTPNNVMSTWDFIPGRFPKCWRVQHCQHI